MMNRLSLVLFAIIAITVSLFTGCGNRDKVMNQEKSQLQERINTTLNTVNERIDAYRAATADTTLSAQNQSDLNTQLSALQEIRTDLTARMDRMTTVTRDEWNAFRDETSTALTQAEQRLQQIPAQPPVMAAPESTITGAAGTTGRM